MEPMYIVLLVLLLFVVGMLSGKIPFGVIAIGCAMLLALTGVIKPLEAFAGFVDKNIILMAGMFILARAFGQTGVVDVIKERLLSGKGGKSDIILVATILGISAVLAQFIGSQTSIMMIMLAFLSSLGSTGGVTLSRMMLPMTFVITMWLGRLPIGAMGVSQHILFNGFIESAGGTELLDMFSIVKATWLPAAASLVYCTLTYKMLPVKNVDTATFNDNGGGQQKKFTRKQEIIVYVCFIGTIVGMLCANFIGEFLYVLPALASVIMVLLGAMSEREALSCIANDGILMGAGVLVIANAMTNSGAGNLIGEVVIRVLGGAPTPFMLLAVTAVASAILTTFTSNTATIFVLTPIICNICIAAGYDPRACILCCTVCSLSSIITPMSSGGAALAYASANLNMKETFKWSMPLCLLVIVTAILNSYMAFPM